MFEKVFFALFVLLAIILVEGHVKRQQSVEFSLAKPGQFPYHVSIRIRGRHICSGALITNNYVLTAARCVTKKVEEYYQQ